MGARYYAPALGRFISRDPIGLAGGINPYGFCTGDPVNYADPEGLFQRETVVELLEASRSVTPGLVVLGVATAPAWATFGVGVAGVAVTAYGVYRATDYLVQRFWPWPEGDPTPAPRLLPKPSQQAARPDIIARTVPKNKEEQPETIMRLVGPVEAASIQASGGLIPSKSPPMRSIRATRVFSPDQLGRMIASGAFSDRTDLITVFVRRGWQTPYSGGGAFIETDSLPWAYVVNVDRINRTFMVGRPLVTPLPLR